MGHTLMVLSILRVLPLARIAIIVVLAASFLATGAARLHAVEVRDHKKSIPVERAHKKTRPAKKRTSVAAPHRSSHVTTRRVRAHRAARRTRSRVVRTGATSSAHAHHRVYYYSTRTHIDRAHREEIAARPHARPVESASLADPAPDSLTAASSTPQQAANRIAARDASVRHPSVAVGADAPEASAASLFGGKIVAMAPLRGSLESLVRQNQRTDADNLERILNDADLHDRIAQGVLVPVPTSSGLTVNADLPADRRYCRPWTANFLTDLSRAYDAQFHSSLEVSSAVRTVEYQKHLMRTNGNAAPAEGDIASPHLTGATIDIAKSGLTRRELYWMRNRLNTLQSQGKIDVEEEFHQACFHITVYRSYAGAGAPHKPKKDPTAPPATDDSDDTPAEVASH
ncbi:MAG: DUF5715 family protein [Terracidiphilus sp.]